MTTMEELFAEAERTGKWLNTGYQDLWFSPGELRKLQSQGRFRWSPESWTLRDPRECLANAVKRRDEAQAAVDRIAKEIREQV